MYRIKSWYFVEGNRAFCAKSYFLRNKSDGFSWHTSTAISGVLGVASQAIESAERKKEMEIMARQKVEFEQSFKDAMTEALPDNATEFDFIVPSSVWQFKDIKCK